MQIKLVHAVAVLGLLAALAITVPATAGPGASGSAMAEATAAKALKKAKKALAIAQATAQQQGPAGAAGPKGDTGAPGSPGANGSPDSALEIRTKLLTVDGTGSNLDADRVDGLEASVFAQAATAVLDGDSASGAGSHLTGTYPSPTIANNAVTGAKVADNTIGPSDLTLVPAFRGALSANATVATGGTGLIVPLDEEFDTTEMHAAGATDVVIARPGFYLMTATFTIDGTSNAGGTVTRSIRVNNNFATAEASEDADADVSLAAIDFLGGGDLVRIVIHNGTTSSMTLFGTNTHLEVSYLGRA